MRHGAHRFWSRSAVVAAPLGVWAVHFFGSYVAVAVGCRDGWETRQALGVSLLRWCLLGGSALALVAVVVLGWRAWHEFRRMPRGFSARVRALVALLGGLAVAWGSVPAFVVSACPAG